MFGPCLEMSRGRVRGLLLMLVVGCSSSLSPGGPSDGGRVASSGGSVGTGGSLAGTGGVIGTGGAAQSGGSNGSGGVSEATSGGSGPSSEGAWTTNSRPSSTSVNGAVSAQYTTAAPSTSTR